VWHGVAVAWERTSCSLAALRLEHRCVADRDLVHAGSDAGLNTARTSSTASLPRRWPLWSVSCMRYAGLMRGPVPLCMRASVVDCCVLSYGVTPLVAMHVILQVDTPERVCCMQAVTDLLDCRSAPADDRLYCRVTGRSATHGCTVAGLTSDAVLLEVLGTLYVMHVLPALTWFAQDAKSLGWISFGAFSSQQICFLATLSTCVWLRSYRRGKPNSGDIDFTILAPLSYKETCKPLLNRILFRLREIVRCAYPSHSYSLVSFTLRGVRARTACVRVHACTLPSANLQQCACIDIAYIKRTSAA